MEPLPEAGAGGRSSAFLAAARRLLAAVWEQAAMRLELFALELAEERIRFVGILVAMAAIVVCIALTIAFVGVGVLIAAWDSPHRVLVAVAFAIGFALAAIGAGIALRHLVGRESPLFRHSLAEWRRDVDGLRPR